MVAILEIKNCDISKTILPIFTKYCIMMDIGIQDLSGQVKFKILQI